MKQIEIEIKFEIPAELIAPFKEWVSALAENQPVHVHLENRYFDTQHHDFKEMGVGLRTRTRNGEQCVQTLKWRTNAELGTLNQFHELTETLDAPIPNLSAFPEQDLPQAITKNQDHFVLTEQFCTDFDRRYWQVTYNNTQIKVTLDQGQVTCTKAEHAPHILREVEFELQNGSIDDLIACARQFIRIGPMHLSYHTKAAWGDRVYHNYPKPNIHRLPWIKLDEQQPLGEAITCIFSSALKHSQYHTQCFFDAPSLSTLMQVRNGFAMIHQALLLFSPKPLESHSPTWVDSLVHTEQHLSWLSLANAQKRWCRADGYKQQRWPHTDVLTKFMEHMQAQWPDTVATQAWMQTSDYLDLQLSITQWVASLNTHLHEETHVSLIAYAQKKLENYWINFNATSWQESQHQPGLLKMAGPLRRALIISLCLGGAFTNITARDTFQQAWLDVLQGLEDLQWLDTLETSLYTMTPEAKTQQELQQWLQVRKSTLIQILESSYQNACEQAWYWHAV